MAAFGDTLRQARAHKGISLIEAAQATYINRYYLVALEEENFSVLPDGATFRRGIVRHYATYLGLDAAVLIKLYEESSGDRAVAAPIANPPTPSVHGGVGYLNFSMIGVVAVLLLVGFAWFYGAYFGGTDREDTPTQIIATLTPMDPSELNIPTPTPKPPTPTPEPTQEPTEEVIEQAPVVEEETVVEQPVEQATEEVVDEAPVNYDVASDEPDSSVVASVSVIADGEIYVSVVVDGAPAFDGTLQAGESTPFFNGTTIVVYTSDGALTSFASATSPGGFSMGGEGEQTYTFP
jgi:cytoskeletal protein RodZ